MAAKDLLLTLMIKAKDAASATIRRITSDSTDLASGLDEAGSAADHSGKQLDDVGETAARSGAQLTDAARAAEHFSDQLSEADRQAGRFYDGMGQLKEANGEFVQGAAAAVGSAATLGKTLQGTSGQADTLATQLLRLAPASLKMKLGLAGAVGTLIALGKDGVRSAADLEERLDRVAAVTGATAQELTALKAAADAAGQSTKFTAAEAASGLEILARAGYTARTAIETLPSLLNLATLEGIGLDQAATILNDTLTIFQRGADQASETVDLLAKTSSLANTNISELGLALSYTGSYAEGAGLDLEKMNAVLAVLAQNGLRGERAGTALRGILSQLSDPTSTATAELRKLGITSANLTEVIDGLQAKGDQATAAIVAFGTESGPGLRALLKTGSEGIAEFDAKLRQASGSADAMTSVITRGLNQSLISLGSAWDALKRQFGDTWLPGLTTEVAALTGKLRELTDTHALEGFGTVTAAIFVRVTGAVKGTYNIITLTVKAIGVFSFGTVTAVSYLAEKTVAALNTIGLASDDTLAMMKTNTGAMAAVTQAFYDGAIEDAEDFGADLKQVVLGIEDSAKSTAKTTADTASQAVETAASVSAEAAANAEQHLQRLADQAKRTGAEIAASLSAGLKAASDGPDFASAKASVQDYAATFDALDASIQKVTTIAGLNVEQVRALQAELARTDPQLAAAFDALGLNINQVMGGVSKDFQTLLDNFNVIASSANSTGEAVTQSFTALLAKAKTPEEFEALRQQLLAVQTEGKKAGIEFDKLFSLIAAKASPARKALNDLGVPVDLLRNEMTDTERSMMKSLGVLAKESGASAKEIRRAFANAISKAETVEGIDAIKKAAKDAFDQQRISGSQYRQILDQANAAATELKQELKALDQQGAATMDNLARGTRDAAAAARDAAGAYREMGSAASSARPPSAPEQPGSVHVPKPDGDVMDSSIRVKPGDSRITRKSGANSAEAQAIMASGNQELIDALHALNERYTRQVNEANISLVSNRGGEITQATRAYEAQVKRLAQRAEGQSRKPPRDDQERSSHTVNRSEHVIRLIDPNGQEATLFASSEQDATRTVNLLKEAARRSGRATA